MRFFFLLASILFTIQSCKTIRTSSLSSFEDPEKKRIFTSLKKSVTNTEAPFGLSPGVVIFFELSNGGDYEKNILEMIDQAVTEIAIEIHKKNEKIFSVVVAKAAYWNPEGVVRSRLKSSHSSQIEKLLNKFRSAKIEATKEQVEERFFTVLDNDSTQQKLASYQPTFFDGILVPKEKMAGVVVGEDGQKSQVVVFTGPNYTAQVEKFVRLIKLQYKKAFPVDSEND